VTLQSTLELPSILDRDSTLGEWIEDPRGMEVLSPIYQGITKQMQEIFGSEDNADIGMDPMGFLRDTPLLVFFHFFGSSLSKSPEEIVDELLAKVHGS
jgi:beta-glucosidase